MTIRFHIPHKNVTDLSRASVESYLPEAPNLDKIEVSGGSQNVVGEYQGVSETRSAFRGHMTQTKEQRQQKQGSDSGAGEFTVFYLFEDIDSNGNDRGVTLRQNDLIERHSDQSRFEVVEVFEVVFGNFRPWGRARVVGPK